MERQIRNASRRNIALAFVVLVILSALYPNQSSLGQTFDPLGRSLFSQGRGIVAPQGGTIDTLGLGPTRRGQSYQGPQVQPRIQQPLNPGFGQPAPRFQPFQVPRFNPAQRNNIIQPSNFPVSPAFTRPPRAPLCGRANCNDSNCRDCKNSQPHKRHFIPKIDGFKTPGQNGQLIMTPSRIVAPVGSEVVVLAGICGGDGYFVRNQPLEWLLSNDSVGQIIEVGGMHHSAFNKLVAPNAKKFDGQYAWGRTGLKPLVLTRGTPTPADDIQLLKGQTFLSLSSESPGTTWLTGVAPAAEGWDRRRASTRIHWVDGNWSIPAPLSATAGTVAALSTVVSRADGSGGVPNWKVRYSIVGGAPAEFAPAGSQTAEATTNEKGEAIAQIRQRAGQFEPGVTQVRVDVVRPAFGKEPELVVESGITQVTWSAPALTIRAIGPAEAVADDPFNYRVEVTNPGDQVARGVVVSTKDIDPSIEYISSSPKPTQYGNQYQWELGDIAPGSQSRIIDVQLKSKKRGNVGICFEVASQSDRLRTEACAQTEIAGACIGLEVSGPETAREGDEMVFEIGIVNQCDQPLRNLLLRVTPDAGLVATGTGTRIIETTIDELGFGERRNLPIGFQAIQSGRQCFRVDVVADGGHDAGLLECVVVTQEGSSGIRLQIQGGAPTRVGEPTLVKAVVTNTGNVPLTAVAIENRYADSIAPSGFSSNVSGPEELSGEALILELGRLEPGQSETVDIEYEGLAEDGNARLLYTVTSAENVSDTKEYSIRIVPNERSQPRFDRTPNIRDSGQEPTIGIPQDRPGTGLSSNRGPLQIQARAIQPRAISADGAEQAPVRFRVTNVSPDVINNVEISITLPEELLYSEFDPGESNLRIASTAFAGVRQIDFDTRLSMRPQESVEAILYVSGRSPGRHELRVIAQSDQSNAEAIPVTVEVSQ